MPVQSVSQFSDICLSLSHSSREDGTGFHKENMSMKTQRVPMDSAVGSVVGLCFAFIHFRRGKKTPMFKQTVSFYSRECFFAAREHKTLHKSTDGNFKKQEPKKQEPQVSSCLVWERGAVPAHTLALHCHRYWDSHVWPQ